jgi:hypothetical protein
VLNVIAIKVRPWGQEYVSAPICHSLPVKAAVLAKISRLLYSSINFVENVKQGNSGENPVENGYSVGWAQARSLIPWPLLAMGNCQDQNSIGFNYIQVYTGCYREIFGLYIV